VYELRYSKRFKKDFKKVKRSSFFNLYDLEQVLDILIKKGKIDGKKYQNHKLKGEFKDCYECHVEPDILLIYKSDKEGTIVSLLRIGSHSDLF